MEDFPLPLDDYTKGMMYIRGYDDVSQNFVKAIECFRRAAEQDDARAQFILGMLLLHKSLICSHDGNWDKDFDEAWRLLHKSLICSHDGNWDKDFDEAWRWLHRAEAQNFQVAVELKPSHVDRTKDIRKLKQMMSKGAGSIPGMEKADWWTFFNQMLDSSP